MAINQKLPASAWTWNCNRCFHSVNKKAHLLVGFFVAKYFNPVFQPGMNSVSSKQCRHKISSCFSLH